MSILTDASLEFAKEHISKFYDSDFFPKTFEFEAIWHNWDDVKTHLLSKNVSKIGVTSPRALSSPKTNGGFRIVHQLEPIESVVYTALAAEVAEAVENARMDINLNIACAYRFKLEDGSFFSGGTGWTEFNDQTEHLGKEMQFVLVTDITDFYNQIYLHRLNNSIESADPNLKNYADDLEYFITTLNNKASKGVPVGPAASIVMSEAVLIDVDQFIQNLGYRHTRYVDDFRIFSSSSRELSVLLEKLTLYLYENHRLTLSSEKTKILESEEFIKDYLHNNYAEQKIELYETLEIFNPYTDDFEEVEFLVEDEELIKVVQLTRVLDQLIQLGRLDLGLARSIIRAGKRNKIKELATKILENFGFFAPVVGDVILYLEEISDEELINTLTPIFSTLLSTSVIDNQLVRFWIEVYLAKYPQYLSDKVIHQFIFNSPYIENQAKAAISTKNIAWVRAHKSSLNNLGGWDRRAILNASRILPSDERKHWLKSFIANSSNILDRWVASWVVETT